MPSGLFVTRIAGEKLITAFEFNRDNILYRMIMNATRLLIDRFSLDMHTDALRVPHVVFLRSLQTEIIH